MPTRSHCLFLSLCFALVSVTSAVVADSLESASKIILVSVDGSGDFADLQAAIDASQPGDVIQLGPGKFETSVVVTKPVTLQGAGWDKTRIEGRYFHPFDLAAAPANIRERIADYHRRASWTDGDAYEYILREMVEDIGPKPTLTIKNSRNVVVKNVSISLPGPAQKGGYMGLPVILVVDAEAKFNGVAVVDSAGDGARVTAGTEAEFEHCLFASIRGTGLEIREARRGYLAEASGAKPDNVGPVKVHDCDFRTFGWSGINVGKGAKDVSIRRCRISQAAYHGIYYSDAAPTIADCWIFNNRRSGVYVRDTTAATVRNNVFLRNGLAAREQAADLIERNTFYAGGALEPDRFAMGVHLSRGSQATVRGNLFLSNQVGIALAEKIKQKDEVEGDDRDGLDGQELALEENLFWDNKQTFVIRRYRDRRPEVERLELPGGNQVAKPGLNDPENGDFAPRAGSLAARMNVGARPVIKLPSPWPVQPEEAKLLETLGETFLESRTHTAK